MYAQSSGAVVSARRLLRVRGHHAVPAVRRGAARLGALAKRRALARALGATAPEFAKLAPEIEAARPAAAQSAAGAERGTAAPVRQHARFLQALAAARGLLFFIDDLHWADQGTLSLLHYLLRHLRRIACCVARRLPRDRARPRASAGDGARRMEPRAAGHAHRAGPLCAGGHRAQLLARCWAGQCLR